MGPFDTVDGDVIGWYGQGIPVDIVTTGTDVIAYPGPASAPLANDVFTLGAGSFPIYPQARTYSIAASVTPPGTGAGSGATAEATVGADGAITGLTITNPGSGYAAATVEITGAGTGATATADVQTSGAVTSVAVDVGGGGYTAPSVTISGGGATTDATAHVLGGVDAVSIAANGAGYKFPTVDFDLPDDPNGVQAQGYATCAEPYPDLRSHGGDGLPDRHRCDGHLPGIGLLDGSCRGGPRRDAVRSDQPRRSVHRGRRDGDARGAGCRPRHLRSRLHLGPARHVRRHRAPGLAPLPRRRPTTAPSSA